MFFISIRRWEKDLDQGIGLGLGLVELEEIVVFFGHGGFCPGGEEVVDVGEEVFVFGLLIEEGEEVGTEFGCCDMGEDGVGAVDGGGEGGVVTDADLEEDEEGENGLGFLIGGGGVELEEGVDVLLGGAPKLGASLEAVVVGWGDEEGLAVGLEAEGKETHGEVGDERRRENRLTRRGMRPCGKTAGYRFGGRISVIRGSGGELGG